MIRARVRAGLHRDDQDEPVALYQAKNTFVLLAVPGAFNEQEVQQSSEALVRAIESQQLETADTFETVVSNAFHTANLTLSFSIALITIREDVAFLKTFGAGVITLHRDGRAVQLVSHGGYGSGKVMEHDAFDLTVGMTDTSKTVTIDFEQEASGNDTVSQQSVLPPPPATTARPQRTTPMFLAASLQRKYVLFGVLGVIGVLLVWNIIASYSSKTAQADREMIAQTEEIVAQKLDQAKDVFELNAGRSSVLISEAKRDIDQLEKKLHTPHDSELKSMRERVATYQKEIVGNAQVTAHEFLDLSLESKDASGSQMWLYDGVVVVLDRRGVVYLASLEKKSLRSIKSSVLERATLVGLTNDALLFYKSGSGIGRILLDGEKKSVVVKNDPDWQSISDMKVYNSNIYLLDSGKGQIWKYIPTEDGYASKSAYFHSAAYAVRATSFAFNQSVYVAQDKLLTKYTSGLQDGFSPQYPSGEPTITRVMTSGDDSMVYLWDRSKGTITSLTEDGSYERTFESDLLKKAASVEVFKKQAYALLGSKLYELPLK